MMFMLPYTSIRHAPAPSDPVRTTSSILPTNYLHTLKYRHRSTRYLLVQCCMNRVHCASCRDGK